MSDGSDSESESFDPMKKRVQEFKYYKMQKMMGENEEQKHPSAQANQNNVRNTENSKRKPGPSDYSNNQAFNHEQGQDHGKVFKTMF